MPRRTRTLLVAVVSSASLALGFLPSVVPAAAAPSEAAGAPYAVSVEPAAPEVTPGQSIAVEGTVADAASGAPTSAELSATLVAPDGSVLAGPLPTVAGPDGTYDAAFPASATEGLEIGAAQDYALTLAVKIAAETPDGAVPVAVTGVQLAAAPSGLLLENRFVSSVGWVKPDETYPFKLIVRNLTGQPASNARVTVPVPEGTTFVSATPVAGAGTATINPDGSLTWDLGSVPRGSVASPTIRTLVVDAQADSLAEDPQVAYKNLSTDATLTADGQRTTTRSHGPKVIPPATQFETARYGDRPFPVVPVEFRDRKHQPTNSGAELATVINDPAYPGSTFNLYQEMSYGQLFPNGTVPSSAIATASFDGFDRSRFHEQQIPPPDPPVCNGYFRPEDETYTARIDQGFYQLPGSTEYYGSDSGIFGDETQRPENDGDIDDACGRISKVVYDAAAIADPEIDYNDYDTDKDGVVDFFMMVYAGCGGNGPSQRGCFNRDGSIDNPDFADAPYDNIWPHSFSLEGQYTDADTGLTGYVTQDPLTDLEGNRLYYTDASYTKTATTPTDFPAFVRVGPYNVNPEDAIRQASVISHEYGHSLGLPDYYGVSFADFYGSWNLMATDKSQHMDLNGRQELGWVIPKEVPADAAADVFSMVDSQVNTHSITWQQPDGTPYTLSGPDVANGDAYKAPLPRRILLDPGLVENGASPTHVWWSQSGNGFGCVPSPSAHSLDIPLDALAGVAPGTPVTVAFNSYFDIEWDFDYGFLLATTDGGSTYTSLVNNEGYTFPASDNPQGVGCQGKYGNGLSGTSGSYENGTGAEDRADGTQRPGTRFLPLTYDASAFAGQATTLRFAYNTDSGLARPGWFIDDVVVTAGDEIVYSSDFEEQDARRAAGGTLNGGCEGEVSTGPCTDGWQYVEAGEEATQDHAYLVEARDRASFDLDGRGQNDRDPIDWTPGVSLVYTDEARGYGNVQEDYRPNQTVLDDQPTPYRSAPLADVLDPNLADAAYTETSTAFSDFGDGHVDNYVDLERDDFKFRLDFQCFAMSVEGLTGDDLGPTTSPGNVSADVAFSRGAGCGSYDYGFGVENARPTAVAQAKNTTVNVGDPLAFDASASADDVTPFGQLRFAWDFDGDGTTDATTPQASFAYGAAGTYTATLTVTDGGGLTATDTIEITVIRPVTPPPPGGSTPTPSPTSTPSGGPTPTPTATPSASATPTPSAAPTPTSTPAPDVAADVNRIAGTGRLQTAIGLSKGAFTTAPAAVLARADLFPDALAASTLAAEVGGPVLLTGSDGLDLEVAMELRRLGVQTVYLAGGTAALSTQVETDLAALDVEVVRLSGPERTATAVAIADEIVTLGGPVDEIILARTDRFADALAASNVGTTSRSPILLTPPDAVAPPTGEALARLVPDGDVLIAGGTEAVNDDVAGQLDKAGYEVTRISGPTRLETAVLLTQEAVARGADLDPVYVANAFTFPDALAAGPAAHAAGGVLLLADPQGLDASGPLEDYLTANADAIDHVVIVGGTAALPDTFDQALTDAVTSPGEQP